MAAETGNYQSLIQLKHFMEELEQNIRFVNREIIHKYIPKVSKDDILSLSVAVGRLRARYLEAAFRMASKSEGVPDKTEIEDLRSKRQMFEEAKSAFEALRYAIEREYVDVDDAPFSKGKR